MPTNLVTPPEEYPVTLEDAKEHLNVSSDVDDTRIERSIRASTESAEIYTGRKLITQTWDLYIDRFYDEIKLPFPPLQEVVSVQYLAPETNSPDWQTLSTSVYSVDTYSQPGRVLRANNQSWPETRCILNAVRIRFTAGYGDAEDVPERFKDYILLDIELAYDRSEDKYMEILQSRRDSLIYSDRIICL